MRCGRRQRFRCDKSWLPILRVNVEQATWSKRWLSQEWTDLHNTGSKHIQFSFVRLSSHVTFAPFFLLCGVFSLSRSFPLSHPRFALPFVCVVIFFFFCRVVSQAVTLSGKLTQWFDCNLQNICRPSHTYYCHRLDVIYADFFFFFIFCRSSPFISRSRDGVEFRMHCVQVRACNSVRAVIWLATMSRSVAIHRNKIKYHTRNYIHFVTSMWESESIKCGAHMPSIWKWHPLLFTSFAWPVLPLLPLPTFSTNASINVSMGFLMQPSRLCRMTTLRQKRTAFFAAFPFSGINENKLTGMAWSQFGWLTRKFVANLINWIILIGFFRRFVLAAFAADVIQLKHHARWLKKSRKPRAMRLEQNEKNNNENNFTFCWKSN